MFSSISWLTVWPTTIKPGIHFLPNRDSDINNGIILWPWPIFHGLMPLSFFASTLAWLTLVLLNPDIPCLCKQCRSRSVGFWKIQLIWICTVCHLVPVCEFISTIWIKESDWLTIRSGHGILIYSAGQCLTIWHTLIRPGIHFLPNRDSNTVVSVCDHVLHIYHTKFVTVLLCMNF